jgi:hypothetical protein
MSIKYRLDRPKSSTSKLDVDRPLVVMKDVAHTINVSAPERLARLVLEFAQGRESIRAAS